MILYTIFDPNIIFNNETFDQNQSSNSKSEIMVNGVMIEVSRVNDSDMRVERIISTNPYDYLNNKIQPGSIIKKQF